MATVLLEVNKSLNRLKIINAPTDQYSIPLINIFYQRFERNLKIRGFTDDVTILLTDILMPESEDTFTDDDEAYAYFESLLP